MIFSSPQILPLSFQFLLGTFLSLAHTYQHLHAQSSQPNIILILADDMGYSDLGCTGSEIETPHLDELAREGVLFTHCYNTSRCCPTRASLLTGLYQHRAGYGHMDSDLGYPAYQGRFRQGVITFPQLLQQAGYYTMMLGKWHLGHEAEYGPLARGFDRLYGIPKGGGVYFYPCVGRDRQVYLDDQQVIPDSSWYSTDAFTDYAIHFTKDAKKLNKPFFMYMAYIAPHFPLQAKPEDIDKYKGKYSKGYSYYRNQRFNKQRELGVISPQAQLSAADFPLWDSINNQKEEELKMAVYAAQIDCMDQNIGKLMKVLKAEGLWENTIILFLSDNGGTDLALNTYPEAEIGSRNCWSAYGKNWANVSNTPYRKYKAMTHEGGIITPLIAHWPEGMGQKGLIIHEAVHITDIAPTILSIAEISYPKKFNGQLTHPLAGRSMEPLLTGEKRYASLPMFFEHMGNQAVRLGEWKLVRSHQEDWELYHLYEDPTELRDLSDEYPERKGELGAAFESWAKKQGVKDWPITP